MRLQTLTKQTDQPREGATRPSAAETAQRWQDAGGIEGLSLEWMLDRARPSQEAPT